MTEPPPLSLADGLRLARLSYTELWTQYVALGGTRDLAALREHVEAVDCPDSHDHNIIAQALNEAFDERGHDHPVGYLHLYRRDTGPN